MNEISAVYALNRILRCWWMVALAAVLGGLIGWLATLFLSPVYEAHATLYVDMNEVEYAAQNQIDFVEPRHRQEVYSAVTNLLYDEKVIARVRESASASGVDDLPADFTETFTVQKIYTEWQLTVRYRDQQVAAALADAWLDASLPLIDETYAHALSARKLEESLAIVQSCFASADIAAANRCAGTDFADLSAFQQYLDTTNAWLTSERDAARQVSSALKYSVVNRAEIPNQPVLYARSYLIAAGVALGLLAGIFLSQTDWPFGMHAG